MLDPVGQRFPPTVILSPTGHVAVLRDVLVAMTRCPWHGVWRPEMLLDTHGAQDSPKEKSGPNVEKPWSGSKKVSGPSWVTLGNPENSLGLSLLICKKEKMPLAHPTLRITV